MVCADSPPQNPAGSRCPGSARRLRQFPGVGVVRDRPDAEAGTDQPGFPAVRYSLDHRPYNLLRHHLQRGGIPGEPARPRPESLAPARLPGLCRGIPFHTAAGVDLLGVLRAADHDRYHAVALSCRHAGPVRLRVGVHGGNLSRRRAIHRTGPV